MKFFIIYLVVLGGLFIVAFDTADAMSINYVEATVKDLVSQQNISGSKDNMTTNFRYIVITDKETFIVENSILNGKFDNSNLFFRLEKDKKYKFKVSGFGKGFLTDYRNILSYSQ